MANQFDASEVIRQRSMIANPPDGFFQSLRFLGPGFILSAAIVGSGELIATTAMGAETGFVLLWVILLSCFLKVTVQLEYGRHCICKGLSSFQAWNAGSGMRFFGVHWSICAALLFLVSAFPGGGGILGGTVQVLAYTFPGYQVGLWVLVLSLSVSLLACHGRYRPVELLGCLFNLVFILAIFYCNAALLSTPHAFTLGDLLKGLEFHLPPQGLALALAVFGITGLGSGEIVMYPYWCLEKGYAAWTGPEDGSEAWANRARGWIRVMYLDAFLSLIVYTAATCGFYFLGAAILRTQVVLADGDELIFQLSSIFTSVLGDGSRAIFMLCAFTALYSTLFMNVAGFSRLWADMLSLLKVINRHSRRQRIRAIAVLSWLLPVIWAAVYLLLPKPLFLVIFMGLSNAGFLLVVAYQALVFRTSYEDHRLTPSRFYDVSLWGSALAIGLVALRMLYTALF